VVRGAVTNARDAARHIGHTIGSGHCVPFVREVTGLPPTASWRRGMLVRDGGVPAGTAIATFDPDGTYGSHVDGRSHAAILEEKTSEGLDVIDCWIGRPVSRRTIRFKGAGLLPADNGDCYYVIEI
jgi:hypothetical protein